LECLATAHESLSRDALKGDKNAYTVLHKVLTQLEDLMNDMKSGKEFLCSFKGYSLNYILFKYPKYSKKSS